MRVKVFHGRTLEEVLPQVRAELGPEAVVLGQRNVVHGGVGGFFGKRMVEVTATDRMPTDAELVELEDRMMNGGQQQEEPAADASRGGAGRFQRGGQQPARGGIDVHDDWDPSTDDALAAGYDDVLRRAQEVAATAAAVRDAGETYEPLVPPTVTGSTVAEAPAPPAVLPVASAQVRAYDPRGRRASDHRESPVARDLRIGAAVEETILPVPTPLADPLAEIDEAAADARLLALRAHEAIAAATEEIERQVGTPARGTATLRAAVGESVPLPAGGHAVSAPEMARAVAARDRATQEQARGAAPAMPQLDPQRAHAAPRHDLEPTARQMHQWLVECGVDEDVSLSLVQQLALHRLPFTAGRDVRDVMRELVAEAIRVDTGWAQIGRCHRIAVVGASGAGKSSVVAKLAEGYAAAGLRVGVISVIAGVGGRTQIAAQANDPIVRRGTLDVRFAADPEQMLDAADQFEDRDVVLVDTPSAAYLDTATYNAVARCLTAIRIDDVQVVVPLATSVREAESVIDHFRSLGVRHLVVSKLDESRYAGQLLNFGFRFGLPITFLTDGPRIPEDVRAASAGEIAALIVPHHQHGDMTE